jgi:hypothetical protein
LDNAISELAKDIAVHGRLLLAIPSKVPDRSTRKTNLRRRIQLKSTRLPIADLSSCGDGVVGLFA